MRRRLWQHLGRVFRPSDRVLDAGSGTGADAVFLAGRGMWVTAIDISPRRIAQTRARAERQGVAERVEAIVLDIGKIGELVGGFDGIISSFAAINAVPDLARFAEDSARLLAPRRADGAALSIAAVCGNGSGLVTHGRWAAARELGRRPERAFEIGGVRVVHSMLRWDELYAQYFAREFLLVEVYGLGIVQPPSGGIRGLEWADGVLGRRRAFVNWGRFVVIATSPSSLLVAGPGA